MGKIDFNQRHREAVAEMVSAGLANATLLPTHPELMAAITHGAEVEQMPAQSFEAFFGWWDALTGYDQLDEGTKASDHKPILKVAYDALKASGHLQRHFPTAGC